MEECELAIIGCGPTGGTAAREAASRGISTVVLEKDSQVGVKRVCAAGLRPGFCGEFNLPRDIVHCDTPRLALFGADGVGHEIFFGPGHTSTREELDGAIAKLAHSAGADIRMQSLFRNYARDKHGVIVDYADLRTGEHRQLRARTLFFAQGSTARLEDDPQVGFADWKRGLMTTYQYRIYPQRLVEPITYQTMELHYYPTADGRQIIGWMFPKRDHLTIGLGFTGKMGGAQLRGELDAFLERIAQRLFPKTTFTRKSEGHLLYGGLPRPRLGGAGVMVGGTAAGLVDATNGEGIFEAAMSGRFAAESVARERSSPGKASRLYAQLTAGRFRRRLKHRVHLMRFLEKRPSRYALLFEQLAGSPRLADILQQEDRARSITDRIHLYSQGLRLAARSVLSP